MYESRLSLGRGGRGFRVRGFVFRIEGSGFLGFGVSETELKIRLKMLFFHCSGLVVGCQK